MNKLVSVIIPNYNCAEYLDRCLEHIVGQSYPDIEVLICDDASTDHSLEVLARWAEKDSRIRILTSERNQGGLRTYNRLFFEAKGEYIMVQDADDWCDLKRIERQLAILETQDVGCCMTNSIFYYGYIEPELPERPGSGMADILHEDWAPATIMFRRAILKDIPGYHTYWDRVTSFDNYFIMDIIDRFGGYYLDEYLYFVWARANSDHRSIDLSEANALRKIIAHDLYQELKRQRVNTGTDWLKDNDMASLEAYEQKLKKNRKYLADKVRAFACIQIDNGKYDTAWALLKQALILAPFFKTNYQSLLYLLRSQIRNPKEVK